MFFCNSVAPRYFLPLFIPHTGYVKLKEITSAAEKGGLIIVATRLCRHKNQDSRILAQPEQYVYKLNFPLDFKVWIFIPSSHCIDLLSLHIKLFCFCSLLLYMSSLESHLSYYILENKRKQLRYMTKTYISFTSLSCSCFNFLKLKKTLKE